jgi:glycosyltransferase involved in cell wall biosynthesis
MLSQLGDMTHNSLLAQLPSPPPGKVGWPWTEANSPLRGMMPDGSAWPRISVVTPSFNQGHFLEETIRSVLLQGYPNLEYIIIDGASSDASAALIEAYNPWLTYWQSQSDTGQADAINKGLSRSTGIIFNWINSDDVLTPGALRTVALAHVEADVVAGSCVNFSDTGPTEVICSSLLGAKHLILGLDGTVFHQPATWLKRESLVAAGGIDSTLQFVFDWDIMIRYLHMYPRVAYTDAVLARFRLHACSKTVSAQDQFNPERLLVLNKLLNRKQFHKLHDDCDRRLRQVEWWHRVEKATRGTAPGWRRAAALAFAACEDPPVRWSRLTLGAIHRCLRDSQERRLETAS